MEIEVTMDRRLIAQHALVVYGYEKDTRYEERSGGIDHYITKHRVDGDGRLLEGTPLSREMLRRICFLVMPSLQIMEYIPDGVLAHSPGTAVLWWTQGGQRRIFFTNETGLRSGIYPLPAMLFLALNRTLYTWALTATKRPEPGTPIYHSPFFNVYEGGACCMGNIELPENASPANTHEWERAFFDGASNGHIMPKLQGIEPRKLWKTVEKKTDFPNEHLVQCGTVANVIKSAAERPTPWT